MTVRVLDFTPLEIAPGETLSARNGIAVAITHGQGAPANMLTVRGVIDYVADTREANPITARFELPAVAVASTSRTDMTVTVAEGGRIRFVSTVADADSPAIGVWSRGAAFRLLNYGTIEVTSTGPALGAGRTLDASTQAVIANYGLVKVMSTQGRATGLAGADASLHNTATGLIDVVGATGAIGVEVLGGFNSLINRGVIRAAATGGESIGVSWSFDRLNAMLFFENTGTIEADVALRVNDNDVRLAGHRFNNFGTMTGDVEILTSGATLANSGLIRGDVTLGRGDDVYDGKDGVLMGALNGGAGRDTLAGGASGDTLDGGAGDDSVTGGAGVDYLRGGEGNDTLEGGDAFDDINGNQGDDVASGGLGDDWVVGGKDNDRLSGDAGNDLVYGNLGNDTCDGGDGADIVRGGQGDDVVRGGAGDDYVSGDLGADTMTGGAGADIFHSFGEAGLDRVTDFNRAEGDRVQLDPGTQYTTAQVGADTVITMVGGGQLILVGVQLSSLTAGWIVLA